MVRAVDRLIVRDGAAEGTAIGFDAVARGLEETIGRHADPVVSSVAVAREWADSVRISRVRTESLIASTVGAAAEIRRGMEELLAADRALAARMAG